METGKQDFPPGLEEGARSSAWTHIMLFTHCLGFFQITETLALRR